MADPVRYCPIHSQICLSMQEWGVFWQALGVIAAVVFGTVGLFKIYHELRRLNEQRDKEIQDKETAARLKRTEFFLSLHRRLFDDKDLYSVLKLTDGDDPKLRDEEMWDAKRKLLVFFEELALLIRSSQIDKDVALYMFGYYSLCVRHGENFMFGIDAQREYWALFYEFSDEALQFSNNHKNGPPSTMAL
ncbi:hypothetical protein [Paraburkholderia silvatlantica]|uniref:hypothetical protein n=1 Tax=Paraburkholderia silvatlantica TaxID=321895 RepID=UPI00105F5BB4|nr:hypothetical protein [Paraburkholderia silvatlantica]TDQ73650.1 hypothetical protein C7412_14532 [Paraburkholderia silvatlantica]